MRNFAAQSIGPLKRPRNGSSLQLPTARVSAWINHRHARDGESDEIQWLASPLCVHFVKTNSVIMALLVAGVLSLSVFQTRPATVGTPAGEPTADADPWSFDIVPYLWLATYGGSFDLPGIPD